MTNTIFIDIGLILGIAIALGFFIQLLRQPLIISYIITGIIAGPIFLNLINSSQQYFNVFAKFGVILLMFLVGLSLNLTFLKKIGKVVVFVGFGQAICTSLFGFLLMQFLGISFYGSIFLAVSITFSSTIIVLKLLAEKRELRTTYGRYTLGLMLVQDIIAIAILVLLPSLGQGQSFLISFFGLVFKGALLLSLVYLLAKIVLPFTLKYVAKNGEFLLIFTLGWCFAIAGLAEWIGITLEVGAIIAGLSLGSSIYQTEISSRIRPLRDFFIALFFIILGSGINVGDFQAVFWPSIILALFVLVGNPVILYFFYRQMRFTRRNSFLAGLTSAQVSEFGFVFLFLAVQSGYIESQILSVFTIIALITIFFSSYLITYNQALWRKASLLLKVFGRDKHHNPRHIDTRYDVAVLGYHRLGWKICEALAEMEIDFVVVDFDPRAIRKLEDRNIPYFFGDVTEVEFLQELPLMDSKLIISTLPDAEDQITLIEYIRGQNTKTLIIANLSHSQFLDEMYDAGADYIMMPHLLSGEWMGNILKQNNWDRKTFNKLTKKQRDEMRLKFTLGTKKLKVVSGKKKPKK